MSDKIHAIVLKQWVHMTEWMSDMSMCLLSAVPVNVRTDYSSRDLTVCHTMQNLTIVYCAVVCYKVF